MNEPFSCLRSSAELALYFTWLTSAAERAAKISIINILLQLKILYMPTPPLTIKSPSKWTPKIKNIRRSLTFADLGQAQLKEAQPSSHRESCCATRHHEKLNFPMEAMLTDKDVNKWSESQLENHRAIPTAILCTQQWKNGRGFSSC